MSQIPAKSAGGQAHHVGKAPGGYMFPQGSATKYVLTDHLRSFTCKINGRPRPQYRNFATTTKTTTKVKMFSPSKVNQILFLNAFKEALNTAPSGLFRCNGNPCTISVKFFFPRPKSHFSIRPNGEDWPIKTNAAKFVTHAPDVDNCMKLVLDALQGTAYKNDSCVIHIKTTKLYDPTQVVYRDGVKYDGTTLIKVVEIDPAVITPDCNCICCTK